ncbi:SDR family oxidoreductase [Bradyrhizobium sp. GCM10027634]|uniref:SDR family oxidoreductase n=1 Tax=unclassified Bradyrhizobium TaxID=2631580 RepID=UPI00188C102C|nr:MULTISPECIES: SDR family oxidoreductase [unclassified Bradyrhizobium]MDN5000131.1 SDR family oxidoreductase [Bradyrhizobium sp. WYCCWR 12677]QOZ43084.1 sugar dehydrogenase [Bradyrhizobium sp. CCBAU 53340]
MPQTDLSTAFPSRLVGRHALVTGAPQGIGRAVAVRLAQEGATVAINYIGPAEKAEETLALARTASSDRGHGRLDHFIVHADIGVEQDIAAMFETVLARWKRLDCLVNNAGFQQESASEALDVDTYRRIIDVNLNGAVLCAQKALAHFVARGGGGSIINCSSVHQIIPKPGYLAYSISKGAMANLTRTLALEFAGRGIRVNAVGPGAIDTPINAAWTGDPDKRGVVTSHIPMGRVGTPEEIAAVFAFLASDDASYITGQTIYACGGLTLFPEFRENWAS